MFLFSGGHIAKEAAFEICPSIRTIKLTMWFRGGLSSGHIPSPCCRKVHILFRYFTFVVKH